MKQVNRIENVREFKYEKERDILWIVTMDKKLKGLSPENEVVFLVDQYQTYNLDVFPDSTIVFSTLKPEQTFVMRGETPELATYILHLEGRHYGDKFYCVTRYKGLTGYSRLDKKTLTLDDFWPLPFAQNGIQLVTGDKFVSSKKEFIAISAFSDGTELARYDFAELLGVEKASQFGNMVSHKGLLYFYVIDDKSSKYAATFCMDEATGKIVNRWDGFGGNLFVLGDSIYASYRHTIEVLDTVTGQVNKFDLEKELEPLGLQIRPLNSLYPGDGLLYFVDGHWAPTNRIGIIDLKTKKLSWHTEISVNDGVNNAIRRIAVQGDKLYAIASDNVLHVFQRE